MGKSEKERGENQSLQSGSNELPQIEYVDETHSAYYAPYRKLQQFVGQRDGDLVENVNPPTLEGKLRRIYGADNEHVETNQEMTQRLLRQRLGR